MTARLVNAAMMPAAGTYVLRQCSPAAFAQSVREAHAAGSLVSYVGYPQTAGHLSRLCGVPVALNRALCVLDDGDTLLICRLGYRVADPGTKGAPVPDGASVRSGTRPPTTRISPTTPQRSVRVNVRAATSPSFGGCCMIS